MKHERNGYQIHYKINFENIYFTALFARRVTIIISDELSDQQC